MKTSLYSVWQFIVVTIKTGWDFFIIVVGKIPTVIVFLVKNVVYITKWALLAIVITLVITLIMNFLTEIAIWVWYHLDVLIVDILNIIYDFYNILIDLIGLLFSFLNYPIEVIRVFLFETYDGLCKNETITNCLGADNWIWFLKIHWRILVVWGNILKVFTENLRIAITEFICQQGILITTGDPYFCFIQTTINIVKPL